MHYSLMDFALYFERSSKNRDLAKARIPNQRNEAHYASNGINTIRQVWIFS